MPDRDSAFHTEDRLSYNISNISLKQAGPVSAAPEPASWAMMILGFGMVGGALRRRRAVAAPPVSSGFAIAAA